jgi:hypothetical protein
MHSQGGDMVTHATSTLYLMSTIILIIILVKLVDSRASSIT